MNKELLDELGRRVSPNIKEKLEKLEKLVPVLIEVGLTEEQVATITLLLCYYLGRNECLSNITQTLAKAQ